MSHGIGFYEYPVQIIGEQAKIGKNIGYFFGYARGIFYRAFQAQHCDDGFSGSNMGVIRTADQVRQALEIIRTDPIYTTYPDPKRISDIVEKLETYLEHSPDGKIYIHFS